MTAAVELIGPKGYTHNWVYHGPSKATALHTRRMSAGDVGRFTRRFGEGPMGERADKASAYLRGRKVSDYQHLAAARMHAMAARGAGDSGVRAHHLQMARMHRGIATRNVGRQVASEGRMIGFAVHPSETAGGRKSALKRGLAIPPPSKGAAPGFPVTDASHWEKARQAIGRVKNPKRRAQVAALQRRTAPRFGKTAALKESWAAPGGSSHSNLSPALEMTMTLPRFPVSGPYDLIISRGDDGSAVVRHRRGGYEITRLRHTADGWVASAAGRDGQPHTRQRGALLEAIGRHNAAAGSPYHRAAPEPGEPLQPPPVQTDLMKAYGIPAIRALATPAAGASDGVRETGQPSGLSDRGSAIYKKLRSRGFPHARAHAFASRAQNKVRK